MKSFSYKKLAVYLTLYAILGGILLSVFTLPPSTDSDTFFSLRVVIIFFASLLLTKYTIYMVLSPWNEIVQLQRLRRHHHPDFRPLVSVIIPAWNEGEGIITTVRSLLTSKYTNLEIIVVDNASTDGSDSLLRRQVKILKALKKRENQLFYRGIRLSYYYEGTQGKGHALNHGLSKARGEIIISIDADCFVPPNTIGNFVKQFSDPKVMAAVGNVRIGNTDKIIGVVQYLEFLFSFYFKKAESLVNSIYIIGGAAGAFRRQVFTELGPYSTTNITEDIELSLRVQSAGMRTVYAEDAILYTEGAPTLTGLLKQRLRWKRGRIETFVEHKNMFFSRDKKHNRLLTWVILPLAVIGDLQLAFEGLFLAFLYIFSLLTKDFTSFISGIIVVSSMFLIQVIFDNYRHDVWKFVLLAPIGWLLFYISTFVETYALFKAYFGHLKRQDLKWQQWERRGVFTK